MWNDSVSSNLCVLCVSRQSTESWAVPSVWIVTLFTRRHCRWPKMERSPAECCGTYIIKKLQFVSILSDMIFMASIFHTSICYFRLLFSAQRSCSVMGTKTSWPNYTVCGRHVRYSNPYNANNDIFMFLLAWLHNELKRKHRGKILSSFSFAAHFLWENSQSIFGWNRKEDYVFHDCSSWEGKPEGTAVV